VPSDPGLTLLSPSQHGPTLLLPGLYIQLTGTAKYGPDDILLDSLLRIRAPISERGFIFHYANQNHKMTCEACNTIPPVVAEGYEEKGKWEEIGGLKTCESLFSVSTPPIRRSLLIICAGCCSSSQTSQLRIPRCDRQSPSQKGAR
jgi:hypothetical protein